MRARIPGRHRVPESQPADPASAVEMSSEVVRHHCLEMTRWQRVQSPSRHREGRPARPGGCRSLTLLDPEGVSIRIHSSSIRGSEPAGRKALRLHHGRTPQTEEIAGHQPIRAWPHHDQARCHPETDQNPSAFLEIKALADPVQNEKADACPEQAVESLRDQQSCATCDASACLGSGHVHGFVRSARWKLRPARTAGRSALRWTGRTGCGRVSTRVVNRTFRITHASPLPSVERHVNVIVVATCRITRIVDAATVVRLPLPSACTPDLAVPDDVGAVQSCPPSESPSSQCDHPSLWPARIAASPRRRGDVTRFPLRMVTGRVPEMGRPSSSSADWRARHEPARPRQPCVR